MRCIDQRQIVKLTENMILIVDLVHLQTHAVVDLVIRKRDVVFVDCIPFLKLNLGGVCPGLCGDQFLEVAYCIVWTTLYTDFSSQTIVCDNFDERHRWMS